MLAAFCVLHSILFSVQKVHQLQCDYGQSLLQKDTIALSINACDKSFHTIRKTHLQLGNVGRLWRVCFVTFQHCVAYMIIHLVLFCYFFFASGSLVITCSLRKNVLLVQKVENFKPNEIL